MSDASLLKNLTDHYIQVDILARLAKADESVRFTDLKDPGIENSLFMYHANKLLDRGLIIKNEGSGFSLTPKGGSWINFIGYKNLQPQVSPRLLVQFLITNNADEVLLSRRAGSIGKLLNEYMLPGGLYKYGKSADDNARTQLANFLKSTDDASLDLLTIAETIHVTQTDEVHHSISYIYRVEWAGEVESDDPQYELTWFKRANLIATNDQLIHSRFIPELFTRLDNGLKPNELFRLD